MAKAVKLSIVIVNYNTFSFLSRCLDSIYKRSLLKKPFEIIVVDNASRNNESQLIKKNYPGVKLMVNKKNVGFAKANNQAIKRAKGDLILLLNPDTLIYPDTLAYMIEFMKNHKEAAVATCRVELPDGGLDDACHRGFPTPWRAFCQFSGLSSLFPNSNFFNGYHLGFCNLNKVHPIESCAGAFMLVKKKVGDSIGWLDQSYFWYGEDLDFCFRVRQTGWKVMFVPQVKILHYKGVSGGIKKHSRAISTADKNTKEEAMRARFEVMRIFYEKHYKDKYPKLLNQIVLLAIKIKEWLSFFAYANWN